MDKYYYLAAQFPSLFFGKRPSISRDDFLSQARKWLSPDDFSIISGTGINNFSGIQTVSSILNAYSEFERKLLEELYLYRRARKTNSEYKLSLDLGLDISKSSPLDVEKALLFFRWQFLEEQSLGHYFDLEFLVVYFLKLQVLEELFTFDKIIGKEKFEEICRIDKI